jgi:hypothetical protein
MNFIECELCGRFLAEAHLDACEWTEAACRVVAELVLALGVRAQAEHGQPQRDGDAQRCGRQVRFCRFPATDLNSKATWFGIQ